MESVEFGDMGIKEETLMKKQIVFELTVNVNINLDFKQAISFISPTLHTL